jgi:DNA-binding response OmpR family regulator
LARILVVEDEQKVASFIKKGLEEEGYAVDIAGDGEEGLAIALEGVHDLIILDIRLPKTDGLPSALKESIKNPGVIHQSGVEWATPPVSARLEDGAHEDQSPTRGVR